MSEHPRALTQEIKLYLSERGTMKQRRVIRFTLFNRVMALIAGVLGAVSLILLLAYTPSVDSKRVLVCCVLAILPIGALIVWRRSLVIDSDSITLVTLWSRKTVYFKDCHVVSERDHLGQGMTNHWVFLKDANNRVLLHFDYGYFERFSETETIVDFIARHVPNRVRES